MNALRNPLGRLRLAALALLLVACAQAPGASPTPSPSPTSPAPSPSATPLPPAGLVGRTFLSTAVTKDGQPFQLAPGTRVRLTFDQGRLSANAGCNIIGGNLTIDGNTLHFSGASMTEMACPEPAMSQDQWLIDLLSNSPTFVLDGNNLTITSGTTVVTLLDREVAEPDQSLIGPTWILTSIISGDVASSIPVGINAQITFGEDGTFSFNDGCNSGGGNYLFDGGQIAFSNVIQTEMACGGAAGQVEQAVLAVIGFHGPIDFAIDANSLSLTAGNAGLQFTASAQ